MNVGNLSARGRSLSGVHKLFNTLKFAAAAVAVAAISVPAAAVTTIDFTNIKGTWFDVALVGGPALGFTGNGTANASVRWGNDIGNGRSGYDFQSVAIPQLSVTPPGGSAVTQIATFRHVNQPIAGGTSITSAKLKFTTDVIVNGSYLNTVSFIYNFNHDETNNGANPCAYGGANNQGVNINGCADRVQTIFNSQSEFFTIDGNDYALDVVGFLIGTPGTQVTNFLTTERATNEAFILGRVVLYSSAVPESATWAMLIAGFGLVGAASRRQRAAQAAA
jgi:hypothetical protein